MQETKVKIKKENILQIAYFFTSIMFAFPSIAYLIKNKTIYHFTEIFSYIFVRTDVQYINNIDTLLYLGLFFLLFYLYFLILKNISKVLKNEKQMYLFILIIGILFTIIIPTTSLDVYSYIGNGWVDSHYHENPYYTPVQEVLNTHGFDEMLGKVARCWREETVIYGPAWSLICKVLTMFSFGKITNALYIFKFAFLVVFMGCNILIYKITKKKFWTCLFGLNPFILFEFLSNFNNDIFLVFFILLAIYFIKNKKNIALAVASLAIATAMKYLSILLVPFILIYALKDENLKNRIKMTVIYAIEFCIIILAFYLVYVRDFQVLKGIFIQQNKYGRSIALALWYFINGDEKVLSTVKIISLAIFAISYITIIIKLFFNKNINKISFRKLMQTYQIFLIIFTFILITNFNAWYVIWLFPSLMWQKSKNIRTTLYLSSGVLNSYAITYATKIDDESVGLLYLIVMVLTIVILTLGRKIYYEKRKNNGYKEI